MTNEQWKTFFICCRSILGKGESNSHFSNSWCAWTTFSALEHGVHYWYSGIPDYSEILDTHIVDGGLWRQPFNYDDLAHVIVPANFYWETKGGPGFQNGTKTQNIKTLSDTLSKQGVEHRLSNLVLEIKIY